MQFDSQDPYEVLYSAADIGKVPPLALDQYVPRASTPLYDAMGRGILELMAWLAALPYAERPGRVIFVPAGRGQEEAGLGLRVPQRRTRRLRGRGPPRRYKSRLVFDKSKNGNDRAWEAASRKIRERRMGAADVAFDEDDRRTAGRG